MPRSDYLYHKKCAKTINEDFSHPTLTTNHFAAHHSLWVLQQSGLSSRETWGSHTAPLQCPQGGAKFANMGIVLCYPWQQAVASDTSTIPWDDTSPTRWSPVQVAAQISQDKAETNKIQRTTRTLYLSLPP